VEVQLALLHNTGIWHAGDILTIQEPYLDFNNRTCATPGWHVLYPSTHLLDGSDRSRSILLIRTSISTNDWAQVAVPSPDVTAVRLHSAAGWILCINVYNPCDANTSLAVVDALLTGTQMYSQVVLLGDFNRHHPLWDEDRNGHLFTAANLDLAQPLLDLTSKHGLIMALPKDLPTLQSMVSKNYTRPDNVFVSGTLAESLTSCTTIPEARPPCTDHLPIRTILTTAVNQSQVLTRWDWRC
jgi:hypothetical protein